MRLMSVLSCVLCAFPALAAVEPVLQLGPEQSVSAGFGRRDLTQYQCDLRCDPVDPARRMITCKLATDLSTFERRTMSYVTLDDGASWSWTIDEGTSDPDGVYDAQQVAHRSFIWLARGKRCGYRRSRDGGLSWEEPQELPTRIDHMHITSDRSAGPHAGRVYIVGRRFGGDGLSVLRSGDGGDSFTLQHVPLRGDMGKGFVYGPAVTARGSLLVPYTSAIQHRTTMVDGVKTWAGSHIDVAVLRFAEGGEAFSLQRIGSKQRPAGGSFPVSPNLSQIAVDPRADHQRAYLVYPVMHEAGASQLLLSSSSDDGASWSPPRAITVGEFPAGFAPSACSVMVNNEGVVGVQWLAINATGTAFHCCFMASTDGGDHFGRPVQLSSAVTIVPGGEIPMPTVLKRGMQLPGQPRTPGRDQIHADVGADGRFHLVWTDARDGDPLGNDPGYAIYTRSVTVD